MPFSHFLFSHLYLFFGVNHNCLTAKAWNKQAKVALWRNIKAEKKTRAGNKHHSIHLFSHWTRPFHNFPKKQSSQIRQKRRQSAHSRADILLTSKTMYNPYLEKLKISPIGKTEKFMISALSLEKCKEWKHNWKNNLGSHVHYFLIVHRYLLS